MLRTSLSAGALMAVIYAVGLVTGWVLGARRARRRTMEAVMTDPARLRRWADEVQDARWTAASADATRRVGGLVPRPPEDQA